MISCYPWWGVSVIDDSSRWFTTYEAMLFVRDQGKRVSTASVRRACEIGAIPLVERHAIGNNRDLWLIARQALIDWVREGMPGRHHYQVELIRSGKQQIPERLRKTSEYGVCWLCGNNLEFGVTDWQVKHESGEIVIVHDPPAIVCPQCGDATARTGVLEHVDQLIASGRGEIAQHRVIRYEPPPEEGGTEGNP